MENQHTSPLMSTVLSILSTVWAFISIANLQTVMAIVASCVAMVSGFFAIRYYWYATKEKKQSIKSLNK